MIQISSLLPLQRTRNRLDEESRCHEDIVQYLKTHQGMLEGKLEYWIAKYEKDTEEKSRELDGTYGYWSLSMYVLCESQRRR